MTTRSCFWGSRRAGDDFQGPPLLARPITEGAGDCDPPARSLRALPSGRLRGFLERADCSFGMPPLMRGFEGQHVAHAQLSQPLLDTAILAVERVRLHRPKWDVG